ncbi:polysaccharide lyase family 7 protein [Vibrio sp. Sgm 22]|uniref:polysaccharide lyase family 7 protein n=1 Tax=unclassified Vibrio TaxID=2614977 RepID=UPI0022488D9E|nr:MULTISPECIES: polysaccharide lyase family 7 protein [unclassified Vibrio]MCX2757763.1 polysaccharide lyase family 7 protein [Vibrio sp. 14G-20]MCX2774959.1 polysaccharide lyase family 7 protein [Vibrio sp. Sgm 22]
MTIKRSRAIAFASVLLVSSAATASVDMNKPSEDRGVPADYSQFSNILSASKLQISDPNGKKGNQFQIAEDSNFTGMVNESFFVDKESEALVFKMANDHRRNEVRVLENFRSDLPDTFYRLNSSIEPVKPEASMVNSTSKQNEITYIQVHNSSWVKTGEKGIPHPLLRVVWKEESDGLKGHYWAIVKANNLICKGERGKDNIGKEACSASNAYKHYHLGPVESKPTDFDVIVGDEKLVINVNGEQKVSHNIDYWSGLTSYFKAGVYNQYTDGESQANFHKLEYIVDKS